MNHCHNCTAELGADARFCPSCGTLRPGSEAAPTSTETPTRTRLGPPRAPSAPPTPSSPSGSYGAGRFIPGTMLAGRFRVIGLIGKGGMGEVYRADDVKLGQAVALKFLPEAVSQNPDRLARFFNEVRTARQVTHPNVCRVYDIDEVDGQQFLSMEHVDGEDLATLLRRIGRLPKDKAVQMARQLCAGVAAAHDQGILHRDLKPANVMIDGRGRVKITDFGLAGLAGEIEGREALAGTPAYMAPEQLAGRDATVRSDIYALGLVLYEIFTGKPAYKAKSAAEYARLKSSSVPTRPSSVVEGFDPAVERVILRCLSAEPAERPGSALAVAAALPGGDPLAAALEAGETPSPELVAEAGGQGSLRPPVAVACLLFVLAGLGLIGFLEDRTQMHAQVPLEKPPAVLIADARSILAEIGITDPPADEANGFDYYFEYLNHLEATREDPDRWEALADHRPTAIDFWYRRSPRPLVAGNFAFDVRIDDPAPRISGMAEVGLDSAGRLFKLQVIPPQRVERSENEPEPFPDPDWGPLFDAAELDPAEFTAGEPEWLAESYCDRRAAWTGTYPNQPDAPIRVEACSFRGRPVFFEINDEWLPPWRMEAYQPGWGEKANAILFGSMYVLVLAGALFLTRRNLRLGRGDRRGALRLGLIVFLAFAGARMVQGSHLSDIGAEIDFFTMATGAGLHEAAWIVLMYLALEPFIRRRWPETLIAWTRLLDGRWRDARVGRDLLIGAAVGMAVLLLETIGELIPGWIGWAPDWPRLIDIDSLRGTRFVLGEMLYSVRHSIVNPVGMVFLLVLLRFLLRKQWLAVGLAMVIFSLFGNLDSEYLVVELPLGILISAIVVFAIIRFGLLAFAMAFFVWSELIANYPVTLDFSAWYASASILPVLLFLVLVFSCFYSSLGGRPVFADATLQEETA